MDTIPARLAARASELGDRPALYSKHDGAWVPTSWSQYHDRMRRVARALVALGFEPGQTTAALGFNSEAWVLFLLGTMQAGGACAGIYATSSPEEVAYILNHSEARFIAIENRQQWEKIAAVREQLPHLVRVVMMPGGEAVDDPLVVGWNAFLEAGNAVDDAAVDARLASREEDDTAVFIYTSGTTGTPKAVMLTHRNLCWTASCAGHLMAFMTTDDVLLSYLPLSHIAEQMFSVHSPITTGSTVWFAESIEKLPENLKEASPTILFGVPRIWEKFHAKVSARMHAATGLKRLIGDWAFGVGQAVSDGKKRGEQPSGLLRLKYRLADRLVYSKVKEAMGLSRARFCVVGAAPVSTEVLEFFAGLDLIVQETYGQSEGCGPSTFNLTGAVRFGTVGVPIPGTEVRFAEDGEILFRGPNVFKGYYKDAAATAETLDDEGWLRTGDLGEQDADGFVRITGRKKDILITAGGKNIAPKAIESALTDIDIVHHAVVIGDGRRFLSALITLAVDEEATQAFAERIGVPVEELHEHAATRTYIQQRIDDAVNPRFARVEHIRKFALLSRPLTLEDKELTPTLKVKRAMVNANWSETIESLYA